MASKPVKTKTQGASSSKKVLSNHGIVTIAVYLLGGDSVYVDTEDVAVKANEIAPGRFSWRKYPDQVNLEIIRVYLSDAKKVEKGAYLLGSGTKGWLLTEKGLKFARTHAHQVGAVNLSRQPLSPRDQRARRRERLRVMGSEAFAKFQAGFMSEITRHEAEAFFRLDDYVTGEARERKIVRMVNMFGDDPELGQAVSALATMVRGG